MNYKLAFPLLLILTLTGTQAFAEQRRGDARHRDADRHQTRDHHDKRAGHHQSDHRSRKHDYRPYRRHRSQDVHINYINYGQSGYYSDYGTFISYSTRPYRDAYTRSYRYYDGVRDGVSFGRRHDHTPRYDRIIRKHRHDKHCHH